MQPKLGAVTPLLSLLAASSALAAGLDKTHGVHPNLLSQYVPLKTSSSPQTWKCLDGSKEILWSSVNDDYCDCPDGSDEPGTGACPNSTFYCRNEGHLGSIIPASRVNDGLCEAECCDGSDELPGVCPNICKEVGEAYRKAQEEVRKVRKKGSKIRSSYIAFAQKEKKRLEGLIESTTEEIAQRQKEVERLRDIVERSESLSAAALEHKKASPLYETLIEHANALKSLQREHKKHLERKKALGQILDALRTGYNPNYQDMAVLEAVRGWESLAGLPHINDVRKEEEGSDEGAVVKTESDDEEELDEGMWTAEDLEKDLDNLLKTDYVSLLLEHEKHVNSPMTDSILFDLAAYLPDALVPQYETFRETVISWLRTLGIVHRGVDDSGENTKLRQSLTEAEQALRRAENDKKKAEDDLSDLFDPEGYGAQGEWKKLEGTCLEKDVGDYTYEVCLFDEARQKPNKGGQTFSLGKFHSWNPDAQPGNPEYYTKQLYRGGTKCWNGPNRSVMLILSCGTENAIHTVAEPEKCEYHLTGTTPALCLPFDSSSEEKRDEL
ncbi:hypothetical protein GLOTRDRAFT_98561 [Gloeophyllum trabeum ATCC 11539]|uniref:Glucosidase 2 subunit beta n=1 Tax=Gloeophyllum trabeum (strain ATCC 11539 / FP-39264 / Madison 617) TaxID=670483 RepID=S7QJY9_GLOTA|nr:uncharacterized protein GLOTRDRAFT_98561 [Gloeophyllum trabeum ATCC 11539]EPQ59687.1 hypothetical protein GLOTRDRAFT_98561 [Gloeophyllum trabeum ATCC 11539]